MSVLYSFRAVQGRSEPFRAVQSRSEPFWAATMSFCNHLLPLELHRRSSELLSTRPRKHCNLRETMNPFASLSDENQDQIRKYLKFFRQKKDGILRSIQREINDLESERLNEEVFTREDVLDLVEFFSSAVKSQIAGDVGSIVNMGALALSQLLDSSQDKGVDLLLETHALENQALLEAVEAMSLEPVPRAAKRGPGTLTSFKDEAKAIRDEQHRIEETNKRLQAEVTMLRDRLKLVDKQYSSLSESKQRDEMSSRDLERALEEAKEENAKRISDTTQFQQMRKLMQSQSAKIRDLRKRLQKYEPDAVKEDDDF